MAMFSMPVKPPEADLRSGIILLAVAIGLGLGGLVSGAGVLYSSANVEVETGDANGFLIVAAIVACVGIGHLVSWMVRRRGRS
jgi:uncharacterized transporter YbjL